MALLIMEGFDGYGTPSEVLERKDVGIPSTNSLLNPGIYGFMQAGRIDGESVEMGYRVGYAFTLPQTSTATTWVGWAIYAPIIPTSTGWIFQAIDEDFAVLWSLYHNGTSHLVEVRRGTTTVLGTSTTPISTTGWNYFAAEVFVNDTTGTVKLWVDGQLQVNLSSQDTKPGTTTTAERFYIGSSAAQGIDMRYDDLIFGDDSGTDLTAHPGDCHIEMILPDADGTTNNWTAVGAGTTNADRVDEQTSDDDTTYVHSSTATDKDLYNFASMTGSGSDYLAVQTHLRARKEGAGFREVNATMRSNVTEVDGGAEALSVDYQWFVRLEENDPDGGGAWTLSAINAVQAGIELQT